jgi:hypothetical protein
VGVITVPVTIVVAVFFFVPVAIGFVSMIIVRCRLGRVIVVVV